MDFDTVLLIRGNIGVAVIVRNRVGRSLTTTECCTLNNATLLLPGFRSTLTLVQDHFWITLARD